MGKRKSKVGEESQILDYTQYPKIPRFFKTCLFAMVLLFPSMFEDPLLNVSKFFWDFALLYRGRENSRVCSFLSRPPPSSSIFRTIWPAIFGGIWCGELLRSGTGGKGGSEENTGSLFCELRFQLYCEHRVRSSSVTFSSFQNSVAIIYSLFLYVLLC